MLEGFSKETRFLLSLLQRNAEPEKSNLENLDWDLLLKAALYHLVVPLVHQKLISDSVSDFIPPAFLENLRVASNKIAARNVVLRRELIGLLKIFEEKSIPVIPFKGPVLTERLYGNAALRHYDDLDLLIHKQDISRVKDLLFSFGYKPKKDLANLAPAQEKAFLRFHYTYDFISKNAGHQLEVHWEFVAKSFSLDLDYDSLWKRCREYSFDKLKILAFSPEDLLLTLCITGAKKSWDRLLRVSDVARAILVYPELNWEQVGTHARNVGCERILLLGVSLASTLLETNAPKSIILSIEQDDPVQKLCRCVIQSMFGAEIRSVSMIQREDQFQPIQIRMRERFWDQFRYCVKMTLTPGVGEWAVVSLPGPLYFLYYFLRPIRLSFKTLKRLPGFLFERRLMSDSNRLS
jgi:hypothetical protein